MIINTSDLNKMQCSSGNEFKKLVEFRFNKGLQIDFYATKKGEYCVTIESVRKTI